MASLRVVWRTPLTTRVILNSRIVGLCTRGSKGVYSWGDLSEDEPEGIGGRRTSEVFVKATSCVERDTELFANYGTKFRFPGVCVCHLCCQLER
jgi:hypothetical protein